ncbi:MAG: ROK family protein [Desertimonas sp.]
MAAPEDARRANRTLLLAALRREGAASRAELSKRCGLTRATVSAVVRELLDDELVVELGRGPSGGVGKPGTLLGAAPDGRHVICLDLSEHDRFVGALVNLDGDILVRRACWRDDKTGRDAVALACGLATDLASEARRPILGVGVASPGIVDGDGVVVLAAHLGWDHLALGAELAEHLRLPVAVVNDADASALAELSFGDGAVTDLVCVRVDQGVGAGLVLDGRLHRGSRHASGEVGHVIVDPDGDRCACGKRGCLETEVSAPLLRQRLGAAIDQAHTDAVLANAGHHLGIVLATVLGALDIAEVVMSGTEVVITPTFRAALTDTIAHRTTRNVAERLVVRAGSFGADDALIGAAARVLDTQLGVA